MNRIPDDLKTLIARQAQLRRQIVAWHVVAQLAGVSKRAVLKEAARHKNGKA